MSEKEKKIYFLVALFVLSVLLLMINYRGVVFNLNNIFLAQGDGFKSYFYLDFHIKYDTNYLLTNSISYPFGEHYIYTDSQPAITNSIKLLSELFPVLKDYGVGLVNFLIIFSQVFTVIFIFLILLEFGVEKQYSALFALIIAMLSPQFFRMFGHISLPYSCFFPIGWFLLIKYYKSYKLIFSVLFCLNALFWFFIHPYLGAILIFFAGVCWLIFFVLNYKRSILSVRKYFQLFLQVVLPVGAFYLVVVLTDPYPDKPSNPWGVLQYTSNFFSVFMPVLSPFREFLESLIDVKSRNWEGIAYVGIATSMILLIVVVEVLIQLIVKRSFKAIMHPLFKNQLFVYVLASIVLLLYSMGYPYQFNKEFFVKLISPFSAFRSLGRFAWGFYYVITTFALVSLYWYCNQRFKRIKKKIVKILVISPFIFLYLIEGGYYQLTGAKQLGQEVNSFNSSPNSQIEETINSIDIDSYQAIFPLPFFHWDSESFDIFPGMKIVEQTFNVASKTGLPTVGLFSVRSSKTNTKKIIQLLSPNHYTKEILYDFPDRRPFLVVYSKEHLSENQEQVLSRTKLLSDLVSFELRELSFDSLFYYDDEKSQERFTSAKESLFQMSDFWLRDSSEIIFYDFDNENAKPGCFSRASFCSFGIKHDTVALIKTGFFNENREYIISFWLNNKGDNSLMTKLFLQEKGCGKYKHINSFIGARKSENLAGDWSLVEGKVIFDKSPNDIIVMTEKPDCVSDTIYIDNLLIRERNQKVVFKHFLNEDSFLVENNQFIKYE